MNDKTNSGLYNSGSRNSGHYNSGDYNSGYYNSGSYNSGSRNSGHYNSGDYNSGYYNSGSYNSGSHNSGSYNSGSSNSGSRNSGSHNSGDYNSGNYNSGFFNTTESTVRLFNKDTKLLRSQLDIPYIDLPLTEYDDKTKTLITRTYKEAWKLAWNKLDSETKDRFKNLPNFDAEIFEEITGIRIEVETKTCENKVVEIDGIKYKLTKLY